MQPPELAFIRPYIELTIAGGCWKGDCPFCGTYRTFHLYSRNGFWHCFGCSAGGDIKRFIHRIIRPLIDERDILAS